MLQTPLRSPSYMARRMALNLSRLSLTSSSDCLRGTALASKSTRTPAIEHGCSLRTYAAKAAKSKSMDAATVNEVTKKSTEKRPRTAYQLFVHESSAKFTAAHPGLSIGERSRLAAAEWKKVPQEEKDSLAARIVLDTPSVPAKLPRSAYQLWMKQSGSAILKEIGGTYSNVGQRAKVLSAEWKKVSEEERSRLAAELEKLRPEREKPVKKRASSPYTIFVQENFNSHRKIGMPTTNVMKELAGTWKKLTDAEKEGYATKAAQAA